VTVETIPKSSALENDEFEALVKAVDLVCVTDADRGTLVSIPFRSILEQFNAMDLDPR